MSNGRKTKIVLNTFGSLGDLHPYIALGIELQKRGHDVLIASNASHRKIVEAEALPFQSIAPDISDFGDELTVMRKVMDLKNGPEYAVRKLLLPNLERSYADLFTACHGASLLVSHPMTFAAPIVAEKLRSSGMHWVSVAIAPSVLLSAYDPPIFAPAPWIKSLRILGPQIFGALLTLIKKSTNSWVTPWHALREKLGMPPNPNNPMFDGQFSPELVLAPFSPLLGQPQPDWPINTRQTGFVFYDRRGESATLPYDLQAFLQKGEEPILFTLGSAAVLNAQGFFEKALGATRRLNKRAVFLVGKDPENRIANPPNNIFQADYAPYCALMPQCAAIVHQGGVGTTAQALKAGKPTLIVPYGFDQPDNAFRVEKIGSGRTLPLKNLSEEKLAIQLQRLLGNPAILDAAKRASEVIKSEDGIRLSCDALDALITRNQNP